MESSHPCPREELSIPVREAVFGISDIRVLTEELARWSKDAKDEATHGVAHVRSLLLEYCKLQD